MREEANPNQADRTGHTPLHYAVSTDCSASPQDGERSLETVQAFVDAGAELDRPAHKGITLIGIAAYHGHEDVVRFVITAGTDAEPVRLEPTPLQRRKMERRRYSLPANIAMSPRSSL